MPSLPPQGSTDWYGWAQATDAAAREVAEGRLEESALRAAFGSLTKAGDAFAGKPDGALTAGTGLDSGQTYTIRSNDPAVAYKRVGGYLTHDLLASASPAAAYAGVELPSRVGRIWAEFIIPAGTGTAESLTLIVSSGQFTQGPAFAASAAHFVLNAGTWSYQTLDDPFATPTVLAGAFRTPLAEGVVHRLSIDFDGDRATITLPGGEAPQVTPANAKILSQRGNHATIESYANVSNTSKAILISAWGADTEEPVKSATKYATRRDIAAQVDAARPYGTLWHKLFTTGPVSVAVTGTTTEVIRTDSIRIPRSKRIRVTAGLWFDEAAPTTQQQSDLYVGAYIDGNGSYGRAVLIKSGLSPANGSGSAATTGRMYLFDIEIDASAFSTSQSYPIVLKAYSNGLSRFTHVQDNAALKRNWISVAELPPAA